MQGRVQFYFEKRECTECKESYYSCMADCMGKILPWWATTAAGATGIYSLVKEGAGASLQIAGKAFVVGDAAASFMCAEICALTPNCSD